MSPDTQAAELEQELRQACALLARRVRASGQPCAEELFQQFPRLAESAEPAVELLYTEFVALEQLGVRPDPADYARRFPRWRDALAEQFQVHRFLSDAPAPPAPASSPNAASDRTLGPYDLLEELARGSMGVVYRARHRQLQRPTAIKMILAGPHASPEAIGRFRAEAEAVARLTHPNIVQLYEIGEADGLPYLALELVAGGSLAAHLRSQPQPPRDCALLLETLARAVGYAHRQGIVHRDLKPANILLSVVRGPWSVADPKIADFGLARLAESPAASLASGVLVGTPSYMAPEQAGVGGSVGPAVDVYALGAILFEMLTGRPPFLADTPLNTLAQVVREEPVSPRRLQPGVPADLATICLCCLAKDPHRRYATADALADDLHRFLDGEPIRARPVGGIERIWKWSRRRPAAAGLLLTLLLALAALVGGTAGINVHLRSVAENERTLKGNAMQQARLLREQLELSRRSLYTIQLAQVGDIYETDPGRALAMLEDAERCPPDLRDFAWGLYYKLCRHDQRTLRGGGGELTSLAFHADGSRLLAAGPEGWQLWDWRTGTLARRELLPGGLMSCCLAGNSVRTLRRDGSLALEAEGRSSVKLQVLAACFARDGKTAAVVAEDRTVRLFDMSTGKELRSFGPFPEAGQALAFAPDGQTLAVVGEDTLRLLDVSGDRHRRHVFAEGGPLTGVAFAPDGQSLAIVGTRRYLLGILNVQTLKGRYIVPEQRKQLRCVAFAPDGQHIAAAGDARIAQVWNIATGDEVLQGKGHTGIIRGLAFTPDGQALASTGDDGTIRHWSLQPPARSEPVPLETGRKIICLAYTADGRSLAVGRDDGTVLLQGAKAGEAVELKCHQDSVLCLAVAPSKPLLATGSENGALKLWHRESGKCLGTLTGHTRRIRAVTFSPDSQLVASAGEDGFTGLWETSQGKPVARLDAGGGPARCVSFSPDGRRLAVGNDDGSVSIWDVATRTEQQRLPVSRKIVLVALFSPDGQTLACAGLDYTASLWDMKTMQRRALLTGHTEYVFSAAFTPDGRTLITGSGNRFSDVPGEVKLWDVATGQARATLEGQTGPVAVHPHERLLATVDHFRAIRYWRSADPAAVPAARGFAP
ncbi:MAG: protein kinase [Planctomycetia bacterium]|nr:protein kinase [Planctomycetia bacterium]